MEKMLILTSALCISMTFPLRCTYYNLEYRLPTKAQTIIIAKFYDTIEF